MVGRTVVLFLKSPLFQFRYESDGRTLNLSRDLVQLKGEVLKEKGAGLWIRVQAMGITDLTMTENLPLKEIFLPFAKIDYMLIE